MTEQQGAPPAPAPYVDLHMHSTASDGALPPSAVVTAARAANLAAIALTDHDTLGGMPEAEATGRRLGVRVIPGVELSAADGNSEVHILGLHLSHVEELEAQLALFRATRRTRGEQIVARLNELGVPVTLDAVLAEAGSGALGRPHIARVLVAGGWVRDFRDAFDRYLGARRPAYVPKHRVSPAEAIALIHQAGGVAVLAHPGSEGTRERLEKLKALGMDGVEVRHPGHSPEDIRRIGMLAEQIGLLPSGGSDWHGAAEGPRVIGVMNVPAEWLARQDAYVAHRPEPEQVPRS